MWGEHSLVREHSPVRTGASIINLHLSVERSHGPCYSRISSLHGVEPEPQAKYQVEFDFSYMRRCSVGLITLLFCMLC
jgi:hypothetical protein